MKPEVSQCGQIYGRYVTVAHDHAEGGGTSGGRIITLCQAKVWGVRGRVDTSLCTCTPRCAQDSLNMAVRCCADTYPVSAGASCATKEKYTGPLKPALVGGTDWWMYGLCGCSVPLLWHWSLSNQRFVPAQTPPLWSLPWCSSPSSAGSAWPRFRCRKTLRSLSLTLALSRRSLLIGRLACGRCSGRRPEVPRAGWPPRAWRQTPAPPSTADRAS